MDWHLISGLLGTYYFYHPLSNVVPTKRFPKVFAFSKVILSIIGLLVFSPGTSAHILLSGGIGLAYLPITVGMTSPSIEYFLKFRYEMSSWFVAIIRNVKGYLPTVLSALIEELIWRSAFVYIGRYFGIPDSILLICGTLLFYLLHWNSKSRIVILTELELLCFSSLLYFIYIEYGTLIGVWLIHFIRNSYLQFHRSRRQDSNHPLIKESLS